MKKGTLIYIMIFLAFFFFKSKRFNHSLHLNSKTNQPCEILLPNVFFRTIDKKIYFNFKEKILEYTLVPLTKKCILILKIKILEYIYYRMYFNILCHSFKNS